MSITDEPVLKDASHSKRALERYLRTDRSLKSGILKAGMVLFKKPAVLYHSENKAYDHCSSRCRETSKGNRRPCEMQEHPIS